MTDVILKREHIDKAKEILAGNWPDFAGTELFDYLSQEDHYCDDDGHDGAYIDALLSFAQNELYMATDNPECTGYFVPWSDDEVMPS